MAAVRVRAQYLGARHRPVDVPHALGRAGDPQGGGEGVAGPAPAAHVPARQPTGLAGHPPRVRHSAAGGRHGGRGGVVVAAAGARVHGAAVGGAQREVPDAGTPRAGRGRRRAEPGRAAAVGVRHAADRAERPARRRRDGLLPRAHRLRAHVLLLPRARVAATGGGDPRVAGRGVHQAPHQEERDGVGRRGRGGGEGGEASEAHLVRNRAGRHGGVHRHRQRRAHLHMLLRAAVQGRPEQAAAGDDRQGVARAGGDGSEDGGRRGGYVQEEKEQQG
mmetsp:Transcript_3977/g.9546  ORF Transcript_3977/g.9546 Transcript_3977/m.9546 type:complete len:276 (-) Transcript_3977:498-1325(-)